MKIHIIDGYGIAFRAFYAFPSVINKHEFEIGGLLGFLTMINNFFIKIRPTHTMIVFDKGKSFRSTIYNEYKANRKSAPDALYMQLPFLRNICNYAGIAFDQVEGYEADDVIASYCRKFTENMHDVCIVSTDKDLMQLVNEKVTMLDPIKWKNINIPEVKEKFGVSPDKVIDIQSLAGDASDNVPGAKGIGPKTAAKLILEYESINNLFDNIESIKNPKIKEILLKHKEDVLMSRDLVTLNSNIQVKLNEDDTKLNMNKTTMSSCGIMLHDIKKT